MLIYNREEAICSTYDYYNTHSDTHTNNNPKNIPAPINSIAIVIFLPINSIIINDNIIPIQTKQYSNYNHNNNYYFDEETVTIAIKLTGNLG